MAIQQVLPRRYIDKQKLATFWRSHADFRGKGCSLRVTDDSYVIEVPREMTEDEIKSVYYDSETLARVEAAAAQANW